jgi:hypothetical protein
MMLMSFSDCICLLIDGPLPRYCPSFAGLLTILEAW